MQNPSALFGMVSHCQTQTFSDFPGLSLSVYGSKADLCSWRAGNGGFGSQICRSPNETPTHSQKRFSASEEKAHHAAKAPRSCLSLPPVQEAFCERHTAGDNLTIMRNNRPLLRLL
ncbi:hypothetical protein KUCAC02_022427 [Chaenocephalus aceratus]|uniref:Uncharacterized protein n=1 Tax=Chaenocephalus aceratus TaxID=36190 RepID=A0ACB9XM29_CHAAC|nr:hypothetical protein KUCAC02_022427 [Chaenocephalus aceratus]